MSDNDCRNDCTLPLRFPRRPGTEPLTGHANGCPCCSSSGRVSQDNRPALSRFNYRIGTYGSIREFLFHQIDKTPELQNWTHRTPDDPAVALLEGAAILGDILTFYQEAYANEAFLRTAHWRESIADLVRLLGYRLSPAVGGYAVFAFEIKKEEPVVIPAGFPLKATLEKLPKPAEFETIEEITAYPWLNRFHLYKPLLQRDIEPSTIEFYISLPEQLLYPVELKPGDRLLMGEAVGAAGSMVPKEPTQSEAGMADAASMWILINAQVALDDANTTLGLAESCLSLDSEIVEKVRKTVEIAASEAKMQAVSESIVALEVEAQNLTDVADSCYAAMVTAGQSASTIVSMLRTIVRDPSAIPGVDISDLQVLIAALDAETERIKRAADDAATKAIQNATASHDLQSFIGDLATGDGLIGAIAQAAAETEAESKAADQAAAEAANKAVRLAAIAASSAAAGASDRVLAFNLVGPANTAAVKAMTDAAVVPGAIEDLSRKALAMPDPALLAAQAVQSDVDNQVLVTGLDILAPFVGGAWRGALKDTRKKAVDVIIDTTDVQSKIQLVVNALSRSTTEAAEQSIKDRDAAVKALEEADRLAGIAKTAAETMTYYRRLLVSFLGAPPISLLLAALTTKGYAEECLAAVRNLVNAIKDLNTEGIREAIIPSGGVEDDEANPARLKNAEIVIVDSLRELHGQKIFKIKGSLKRLASIGHLAAFKLGRSFHHFGYNGSPTTTRTNEPMTSTVTTNTRNGETTTTVTNPPIPERNIAFSRLLGGATSSDGQAIRYPGNYNTTRIVSPTLGKLEFPLDSEVPDIPTGTTMVIQATLYGSPNTGKYGVFTMVRKIEKIKPAALTWGLATGSVSMVTLDKQLTVYEGNTRYRIADIRDFMLHETVSPLLTVKRALEETDALEGETLNFYGTADEVMSLKDRRIMLDKPGGVTEIQTVIEAPQLFLIDTYKYNQLRKVKLSGKVKYVDFPNKDPMVTVFGNLANANEGKTLPETPIGSGDAMQIFQNFKLPKAPLTYYTVPENTPSETPELKIYVDGRQWKQVDTFFGRAKDEQIYIVRQDADDNSWVQFGDGKTGARLTNGDNNVTAIYRIGDGAYGPLKEDTKVQASAKLKNLDKVGMPMDVTGGAPPEDGENARNAAPGKVQSLGRIVSLHDYEAEALAIPGVTSASAAWQLIDNVPTVVVTVLMETGRAGEIQTVNRTLNVYDNKRGAARHTVVVEAGRRMYVAVSVKYALKPSYRADLVEPMIRRALGANYAKATREEDQTGLFSLRRRRFGGREYASSIEGWVQNVEGVLWARTTAFFELSDADDPETITMPRLVSLEPVLPCDSGHILSLYNKHLALRTVKEEVG